MIGHCPKCGVARRFTEQGNCFACGTILVGDRPLSEAMETLQQQFPMEALMVADAKYSAFPARTRIIEEAGGFVTFWIEVNPDSWERMGIYDTTAAG